MFNKGLLSACVKLSLIAVAAAAVNVRMGIAEELPINKRQTQDLMGKTQVLEAEIQRHQQTIAMQPEESKQYQSGFEDGYNKAILDLLKSQLLNDPSLSPKPKGAGLHAKTGAYSTRSSAQQYSSGSDRVAPNSAVTSPAVPVPAASVSLPTTSMVPLIPGETASRAAPQGEDQSTVDSATEDSTTADSATVTTTTIGVAATTPVEQTVQPSGTQQLQQTTAQDWLEKSSTYLTEKNWQQAIEAATQAVALDSNLVDSYIVRSWAYGENDQHQQAMEDIATAIRLDSKNALAYNNRAYIHELLHNTDKAQKDYQQACTLGYQQACETVRKLKQALGQQRLATINRLTDMSYQQFQQSDWQSVVKTTSELLGLDPENTIALVNRAGAYTELGEYKKAMDDCNAALIIDPNMAIAYNNKGYVWELMGELKKAAMEYETACVLGVQQSCRDYKRLSQKVSVRN